MNKAAKLLHRVVFALSMLPFVVQAQGPVAGLDTNGTVQSIDTKTGALTPATTAAYEAFVLGATTRKGSKFYYVAHADGTTANALFTSDLSAAAVSQLDLDRDDDVRAMFFKGKKLFGMFYNGNEGTAGLYKIDLKTGATKLVLDLGELDVEPIPGALAQYKGNYYMLVKPEIDSTRRQLLRFKAKAGSAALVEVQDSAGAPVLCEKLKGNFKKKNFVCLASASSETEVHVCSLALNGKAKCQPALAGILRVGSGHTLLTNNGKTYYAFVYAPGEPDNQHLIKFNAKGSVKANLSLAGIFIGAHFTSEPAGK